MVINMFVESMYEGELKKQKESFLERKYIICLIS